LSLEPETRPRPSGRARSERPRPRGVQDFRTHRARRQVEDVAPRQPWCPRRNARRRKHAHARGGVHRHRAHARARVEAPQLGRALARRDRERVVARENHAAHVGAVPLQLQRGLESNRRRSCGRIRKSFPATSVSQRKSNVNSYASTKLDLNVATTSKTRSPLADGRRAGDRQRCANGAAAARRPRTPGGLAPKPRLLPRWVLAHPLARGATGVCGASVPPLESAIGKAQHASGALHGEHVVRGRHTQSRLAPSWSGSPGLPSESVASTRVETEPAQEAVGRASKDTHDAVPPQWRERQRTSAERLLDRTVFVLVLVLDARTNGVLQHGNDTRSWGVRQRARAPLRVQIPHLERGVFGRRDERAGLRSSRRRVSGVELQQRGKRQPSHFVLVALEPVHGRLRDRIHKHTNVSRPPVATSDPSASRICTRRRRGDRQSSRAVRGLR